MKPNIYFLLSTVRVLQPTAGDKINEIALIKTLSHFANIYYNDQLVNIKKPNFGIVDKPIKAPTRKYDLYYVRNNPLIFNKLPHPKIWIGTPYKEAAFKSCDAIAVLTHAWKQLMNKYDPKVGMYGLIKGPIVKPKRIVVFEQACEPNFRSGLRDDPRTIKIRKELCGGDESTKNQACGDESTKNQACGDESTKNQSNQDYFLIGHFGRISKSCYPYSLIEIVPQLKKKYPDKKIKVVFCGLKSHVRQALKSNDVEFKDGYNRDLMPYALSACDAVVCNHRTPEGHFCGSRRILEAMACGIPIVCGNFMARQEQLGSEYPLFWTFTENGGRLGDQAEQQMIDLFSKLIEDEEFRLSVSQYLIQRSEHYTIENTSKRIKQQLIANKLISL